MINDMSIPESTLTREKVLEENKRVHKLEDKFYLDRHPEQTNFHQSRILRKAVDQVCSLMMTSGRERNGSRTATHGLWLIMPKLQ